MAYISLRLYALLARMVGLARLHGHKSSVLRIAGVNGRSLKMDILQFSLSLVWI